MPGDSVQPRKPYSHADFPDQHLSGLVIAAGYAVHRAFGYGFLEAVYRRALVVDLMHRGVSVEQERRFELAYLGVGVGAYRADIIVEGRMIVEVKTGLLLDPVASAQLLNYLAAARVVVGLVLHFGPRLEIKRVILSSKSR